MRLKEEDLRPGALVQCNICSKKEILLVLRRVLRHDDMYDGDYNDWLCLDDKGKRVAESLDDLLSDYILLNPAPDFAQNPSGDALD